MKGKLFAGLDDAALREIYYAAQVRRIAAQKVITVKGGRPDNLLLLQSGRARADNLTEAGSEILLLWMVPGDIIGLVSLLAKPPAYMASTTTVTECEFLVWNHGTIRRLANAYPQLSENGLRLALHYLGVYMKRHSGVLTKSADLRLAEALLHLATEAGEVQPTGVAIDITNEQLSSRFSLQSPSWFPSGPQHLFFDRPAAKPQFALLQGARSSVPSRWLSFLTVCSAAKAL